MMAAGSAHPLRAKAAANPVVVENQQPGSNAWRMTGPVSDDTPEQIKGYASATSVNQNESRRASRPGLGDQDSSTAPRRPRRLSDFRRLLRSSRW